MVIEETVSLVARNPSSDWNSFVFRIADRHILSSNDKTKMPSLDRIINFMTRPGDYKI